MTNKQKKANAAKKAAGQKKVLEEQNKAQRGSWFGVDPRTKVVENKKKKADKYSCRGNKSFLY